MLIRRLAAAALVWMPLLCGADCQTGSGKPDGGGRHDSGVPADATATPDGAVGTDATAPADVPSDGGSEADARAGCGSIEVSCGGDCVDLSRTWAHCGACGRSCGDGEMCQSNECTTVTGLVTVPAGTFTMGSSFEESTRWSADGASFVDEGAHEVTLSRPFLLMDREVTQEQWLALMGANPSEHIGCDRCPVENVSWLDAIDYANALSTATGLEPCYVREGDTVDVTAFDHNPYLCEGFRLPTEAEWEYAYRAGTSTAWHCGDDEACVDAISWYSDNALGRTHAVGSKAANSWALYDMAGNVFEWVWDRYEMHLSGPVTDPLGEGSFMRVARGGSFLGLTRDVRAARRGARAPDLTTVDHGFRIARSILE